ncbi:hypothetical protein EON81_18045 [bacterium]|nr:MAG: hypothetical protein EON81_18045 [bacterium]
MTKATAESLYEALYECVKSFRLPSGVSAKAGDLARETEIRGYENRLLNRGDLRLIGYVRRGAKLG